MADAQLSPLSDRPRAPLLRPRSWRTLAALWVIAGVAAGVRLHLNGGVFGQRVSLSTSVVASLVRALPWAASVPVALAALRRWPLRRADLLPALTHHLALGFGVVVAHHAIVALLRAHVLPAEVTPVDPWGQLPLDLLRQGPGTLMVYAVLVAAVAAWRSDDRDGDDDGGHDGGHRRDHNTLSDPSTSSDPSRS